MSTVADLMGLGMSPALAGRLGNTPTSLSGAGTAQSGATAISATSLNLLTPASGQTAFVLSNAFSTGRPIWCFNQNGTYTALVYPPSGGTINNGSANASVSLPPNVGAVFILQNGSGVSAENWGAVITYNPAGSPTFANVIATGTLAVTGVSTLSGGIASATPTGATAAAVPTCFHTGDQVGGATTTATNTVFYEAEVFVPCNTTLTGISLYNGATATGNVTFALYSGDGSIQEAKTASTAQTGTSQYQQIAFSSPFAAIGPAKYYVLCAFSSSSATFFTHTIGNFTTKGLTAQTYSSIPATITVPTTFTTAVGPIADTY